MVLTSGPGRPEIGPVITIRLRPDDLELVSAAAAEQGLSRAEWMRRAAGDRLALPREVAGAYVEWLIGEQVDASEIRRVLEKPRHYTDWFQAFKAGRSLDDLESRNDTAQ